MQAEQINTLQTMLCYRHEFSITASHNGPIN